jgi:RNA-directed DNA polymerase
MNYFTGSVGEDKIIEDLFIAYFDARKNKRNTINALIFEKRFEENLFALFDEIKDRKYEPRKSICFVVKKPVKREIFAADFRDRIVHHFIYNYIYPIFEKKLINDTYSCREGKGVHYGIKRINKFIRSCSENYRKECYVLKLDIKEYFMSIQKNILYSMVKEALLEEESEIDFDLPLTLYLLEKTIFNDPVDNCTIKGNKKDWCGLPKTKSLFYIDRERGLPIGNLTSQLFGNVYLNEFDHFIKRNLKIRYYGRYVDDFIIVHKEKEKLKRIVPSIQKYLKENLKLTVHPQKIYLQSFSKGVKYLGVILKPHRIYIMNRTKGNFYKALNSVKKEKDENFDDEKTEKFICTVNSYLGVLRHSSSFNLRKKILSEFLSGEIRFFSDKRYIKVLTMVKDV